MKTVACVVLVVFLGAGSALAGENPALRSPKVFCTTAIEVAHSAKGLAQYTDAQVENGLCMTSTLVVQAIANDDAATEKVCTNATAVMMKEFKRRFGNRPASSVSGKCNPQ